jgi:hypothetical protein
MVYRKPGSMIDKMVDQEVAKVAKKQNISHDKNERANV